MTVGARAPNRRGRPRPTEGAEAASAYRRDGPARRARSHRRPRVVQLLATGSTGGAQESYSGLLLHLDRTRFEVHALSLSAGSAVQRLRRLGIAVDVIDASTDDEAVREVATYLTRHEIDLLHAHMFRAEIVGTRAALAARTPVIVATVHSSRVRSPGDVAALAALTPQMNRLIVPSASIAAKVGAEGRDAALTVIPNGVDLDRFSTPSRPCTLRRDLGLPRGALVIGVVARLEPEKGHRYLIEAMPVIVEAVQNAWLVVVGEGSLDEDLRGLAAALPQSARERVIFTGRRDDVAAITADLDLAVLPSLREAQGISLLEAMARSRPVVATRVGGIPEVVSDGHDGLLVPPASPGALADAVVRALRDPELRRRLGEAGRRTVVEKFSVEAQVRRVEDVYEEELARSDAVTSGAGRRQTLPPERAAV